jgi:hypothetical protein
MCIALVRAVHMHKNELLVLKIDSLWNEILWPQFLNFVCRVD